MIYISVAPPLRKQCKSSAPTSYNGKQSKRKQARGGRAHPSDGQFKAEAIFAAVRNIGVLYLSGVGWDI
jgi:hypothetical protein